MKTSRKKPSRPSFFTWVNRHYNQIEEQYGTATAAKYAVIGAELSAKGKVEIYPTPGEAVRLARHGLRVVILDDETQLVTLYDPRRYEYDERLHMLTAIH